MSEMVSTQKYKQVSENLVASNRDTNPKKKKGSINSHITDKFQVFHLQASLCPVVKQHALNPVLLFLFFNCFLGVDSVLVGSPLMIPKWQLVVSDTVYSFTCSCTARRTKIFSYLFVCLCSRAMKTPEWRSMAP